MAYENFQKIREELYQKLNSANHSVSFCFHLMEIDPSDKTISDYEKALDYAAKIRSQIGENSDAEDSARSLDACLKPKIEEAGETKNENQFSLSFVIDRQNKRALSFK